MSFLLALAASPFVISAITGLIKMFPPITALADVARTPIVRALAALISFAYVIATMYITGTVDSSLLSTALTALLVGIAPWLGSMGVFHAFFQKTTNQ